MDWMQEFFCFFLKQKLKTLQGNITTESANKNEKHFRFLDGWFKHTIGHKEFRDEVNAPIPALSHGLRRFSREVETFVELKGDTEPNMTFF